MLREQALPPGFSVIHSNRPESLRKVVVQWVRRHPLQPLENERFIVQSNGMAQWLKLALAENDGCGICASLEMALPARFLWEAYRAILGEEQVPAESPYDKEGLTWRLLRMLPSLLREERFAPLGRYLADDEDLRKRYQLAGHLADLFDQYQVYRADWLADWAAGADRLRDSMGRPAALPGEQAWQAELWRRVRADLPPERRAVSRADLHRRFLLAARALGQPPPALPRRVIVFGICSLPQQALEALHALSRHCQVLLFVHNPCRHYWGDIVAERDLPSGTGSRHPRKAGMPRDVDPALLHLHANPLLAAWGKQGRDFIGLLAAYDRPDIYRRHFEAIDLFRDFALQGQPASLLRQVQQAVLDLQPLPGAGETKGLVATDDRSIRFLSAHSRQREVEILHDHLLDCFERIPGLKPRDIIVMAPEIDHYAPHVEAVFGNLPPQDARHIPFAIADRRARSGVPFLLALEKLLALPDSRMTVGDLVDLLEIPAFRQRFGFEERDLPGLRRWIEGAGIRWGLDAGQRAAFGLPGGLEQNTWRFGLRRMLLGYAVGDGDPWQGIDPYAEIGGLEAALVGPLAVMLERLERHWHALRRTATARDWTERLRGLAGDCLLPAGRRDRLAQGQWEEALERWLELCDDARLEEELTLPVVREALLGMISDSGISQRFLAGMVNFCTLMPMRAIPFKVVCLLGMNDGDYPRSRPPLDFDLMAGAGRHRPGDRSRREDDRYLFLEALLSAREQLCISYVGRSARDGSERTPSVLVGQLRDYLAAGWRSAADGGADGGADGLLSQLTCQHPLQPFSTAYFQPRRAPDLFTYAHEWREVLDRPQIPGEEERLDPMHWEGGVALETLVRFLKNPVSCFFTQRLGVRFDESDPAAEDHEPFAQTPLAPFALGLPLLEAGLAAGDEMGDAAIREAAERLRLGGALPMEGFGELAAAGLVEAARSMLRRHDALSREWPHGAPGVEIRWPLGLTECACGTLEDWLDRIRRRESPREGAPPGGACARWEFFPMAIREKGKIGRPDRLVGLWVRHLAGCAHGLDLTSYLVAPDGMVRLAPLDRQSAGDRLTEIIHHWWQGLQQPLPVTARTALAYLNAVAAADRGDGPRAVEARGAAAARKAYHGDGEHSLGERGHNGHLRRRYPDFDLLWAARDNCFRRLAETLYAPLRGALAEGG